MCGNFPRQRGGSGDHVADVHCIAIRPSEPAMTHNLARIDRMAMVWRVRVLDKIGLWIMVVIAIDLIPKTPN